MDEEENLIPSRGLEDLANINSKFSIISDQVNRFTPPENFITLNNTISAFSDQLNQTLSPITESINLATETLSSATLLSGVGDISTKFSSLLDTTRGLDVSNLIANDSAWAIKPLDSLQIDFKIPEVELPTLTQFQVNLESDAQSIFKVSEAADVSSIRFGSASSLAFNNPLINLETQNLLNIESSLCKNLELNWNSQDIIGKYNFDHLQGSLALVPTL